MVVDLDWQRFIPTDAQRISSNVASPVSREESDYDDLGV